MCRKWLAPRAYRKVCATFRIWWKARRRVSNSPLGVGIWSLCCVCTAWTRVTMPSFKHCAIHPTSWNTYRNWATFRPFIRASPIPVPLPCICRCCAPCGDIRCRRFAIKDSCKCRLCSPTTVTRLSSGAFSWLCHCFWNVRRVWAAAISTLNLTDTVRNGSTNFQFVLCRFQAILSQLLAADKTYIKMAKDLITSDYVGPVVELLGNMVQHQIISYVNYGLRSPVLLVNLWLQCLTNNANWFKDVNAIYIVDLILRVAYQFQDAWYSAKEFFRFMYTVRRHRT